MTSNRVLPAVLLFLAALLPANLHAQAARGSKYTLSGSDGGTFGVDDSLILYQEADDLPKTKIYDNDDARAGNRDPFSFHAKVGDILSFNIHDTWGSCAGLDPVYLSCPKKKQYKRIGGGWYRSCIMPGGDQGIAHTFTYTIQPEDSCEPLKIDGVEITQAIQSYQTLDEMRSAGPRVPIVADKPAVVRVYFTEVTAAEQITLSIAGDLAESRTIDIQPSCSPEKQRAGQNGCSSADFYFTPGQGTIKLTLTVTKDDGEKTDEEISFTTVRTRPVSLRGLSLCTYEPTPGTWACGDASQLTGKLDLLTRILPAPTLSATVTPTVIRKNVNDGSLYTSIEAWADITGNAIEALYSGYDKFTDNLLLRHTVYVAMADPEPTSGGDPLGGIGGAATGVPSHSAWVRSSALRFNSNIESSPEVTAHEVAHTLGLHHTNTDVPVAGDPPGCYDQAALGQGESTGWSFPDNYLQDSKGKQWGFDVTNRSPIDPSTHFDVSSYCSPRWISPDTYTVMLDALRTASPSPTAQRGMAHALAAPSLAPRAVATGNSFWRVTGRINGTAASFDPLFTLNLVGDSEIGSGDYTLAVDGPSGRIFERHFNATYAAAESKGRDLHSTIATFAETIPYSADATSITLFAADLSLLARIALNTGQPLTVTVALPTNTSLASTVSWNVSNSGNNDASLVQYSADGGSSWIELGVTPAGQHQIPVDFTRLAGGNNSLLRVYVTDGIQTSTATTSVFSVPRKGIGDAHITSPQEGLKLPAGAALYLSGSAWDPEDGELPDASFTWDLDGATSTSNNSFVHPSLTPGKHTITLTARDTDGNTKTASVNILVGAAPPAVNLATGYDNSSCPYVTINASSPGGTLASVQRSTDAGAHYTDLPLDQLPVNFSTATGGFTTLVVRATDTVGQATTRSIDVLANSSCSGATTPVIRIDGSGTRSTLIGTPFESPLAVYVADNNGAPLTGVPLSISAPTTGASATFPSSLIATDSNGYAYVPATANKIAGDYNLQISAYRYPAVSATFQLTNLAPIATNIWVQSGDSQVAARGEPFPSSISVLIIGSNGIAVGTPISFSQPADNALLLSSTTAVTDANGRASIDVAAGSKTGTFHIAVTSPLVTNPAIFSLTVSDAVNRITSISGSGQSALINTEFEDPLVVKVTRVSDGSPVTGMTLTTAPPLTGARAYLRASSFFVSTDDQGVATLPMGANESAGSYTMIVKEAASNGTNSISAAFNLTNTRSDNLGIEASDGDTQTAAPGAEFASPLAVLVKDSNGNPKQGALVAFTAPTSGASLSAVSTTILTGADGIASIHARANATEGAYLVTATVQGGVGSVLFHLTNGADSQSELVVLGGSEQTAQTGQPFAAPLSVRLVEKQSRSPLAGVAVTFATPSHGASANLSAASTNTDANGVASITATANTAAGAYLVSATASGVASPVTFALTNTAETSLALELSSGDQQTARTGASYAIPLAVLVRDAAGHPISGITVNFSSPSNGAGASLNTSGALTGTNGIASVLATANSTAGGFIIRATTPSATGAVDFHLINQASSRLIVVAGNSQTAPLNSSFDSVLQVRVVDDNGAARSGITILFRAPSAGPSATLAFTSAVTGADGLAATRATANRIAGSYPIVASAEGTEDSVSFTLANEGASSLNVFDGDLQSTAVGSNFAAPLTIVVKTASGKPVPGVPVTFTAALTGASATLASATATTDANGMAAVRGLANATSGAHLVTATISDLNATATFHLTNTDFTLTSASSSISMRRGGSTTAVYTITAQAGFAGPLTLACSTPVSGLSCSLSPATAALSGNSTTATLTLTADSGIRASNLSLVAASLFLLLLPIHRRNSLPRLLFLLLVTLGTAGIVTGCGNTTDRSIDSSITVTATSGPLVRTVVTSITIR